MRRLLSLFVLAIFLLSILPALPTVVHAQTNIVITQDNITSSPYLVGGTGTATDPWILEFGTLDLGGGHVWITNFTSGYIVIRNSILKNGGANFEGDSVLRISDNVSNVHITIENTEIGPATGTKAFAVFISASNSVISFVGDTIHNGTSNDWWDAVLCIQGISNTTIYINQSTLYYGGHIIRITSSDADSKIVIYKSYLYGVEDDVKWGTNWRGLVRIDGSTSPEIIIINSDFSAKDSAGSPAVFAASYTSNVKLTVINSRILYEGLGFYHAFLIYETSTTSYIDIEGLTVQSGALSGEDIVHIKSDAGNTHENITITGIRGDSFRYVLGISIDSTGNKIILKNISVTNIDGIVSSGNKLVYNYFSLEDVNVTRVNTKIIALGNDGNDFKNFVIKDLSVSTYSDGMDIRGVEQGLLENIRLVNNNMGTDTWADGNGIYLNNVNNTIMRHLYFEDAGWKNIMLDGVHKNITIEDFIDKENVNVNGQNMFLAIGPWGTAVIDGLTIRNGYVSQEDLITVYDTSDSITDLTIYNVTVVGSSPADWEGGRCGSPLYLLSVNMALIKNVTLIGPDDNAIYLQNTRNVEICYINVTNANGYGIYITSDSNNIYVHNSTFWYNAKSPQAYSDSSGVTAEYNLYTDYRGKDVDGDGIGDTPYAWDGHGGVKDTKPIYFGGYFAIVIINDTTAPTLATSGSGTAMDPYVINLDVENVASLYPYGVYVTNLTQYYIVITGKITGTPATAALYIGGNIETKVTIRDLTIDGSNGHGIVIDSLDGVVEITSNVVIKNTAYHGIFITNSENIVVKGVQVESTGWSGVYAEYSRHLTIENIVAKNNNHYGIEIRSTGYSTIKSITASGQGWDGIYVDNSQYITIVGVTVSSPGYKGIFIHSSNHITIDNAKITYTHDSPILIEASQNIIIKNSDIGPAVSGGLWPGIQFKGGASNVVVEDTKIHDLQGTDVAYGIAVWGSGLNITFRRLEIWGVTMGIEIENTNIAVFENLSIHDIIQTQGWNGHAINIKTSRNVVIKGCTIENVPSVGIRLQTVTDSEIEYNVIKFAKWGIMITENTAYITIYNNTISGSTYYGITVWSGHNITITDSIIENNTYAGILLHNGVYGITIERNIISFNGKATDKPQHKFGLAIEDGVTYVKVTQNSFLGNRHRPQAWVNTTDPTVVVERNYWSDYNGTDKNYDGIGDTPYELAYGNVDPVDPAPLMKPIDEHIWYAEKYLFYLTPPATPEPPVLALMLLVALLAILFITRKK